MTRYLIAAGIGVAVCVFIFYAGREYQRRETAALTVKQLQVDAVASQEIDHHAQIEIQHVETVVEKIREVERPWADTTMPTAVIGGLRDAGL